MIKTITCIECPQGCALRVDIENCRAVKVQGNQCLKGEAYAYVEIENPLRILTSTVLAKGVSLRLVPVRTDKPIPRAKTFEAMEEIKRIRIEKPLKAGEIIASNFLGLGVNLIATRDCI